MWGPCSSEVMLWMLGLMCVVGIPVQQSHCTLKEVMGSVYFQRLKKKILFCISDILILSSLVENLKLQKLQKVKASRFWRNKVISVGPGEDPEQ